MNQTNEHSIYNNVETSKKQFLTFISQEKNYNLENLKARISQNAKENTSISEFSKMFINKFGNCFEGKEVKVIGMYPYGDIMFSAANIIALTFLKVGEKQENIALLNIALAFFKSLPRKSFPTGGTDICYIDYIDVTSKEINKIKKRENIFQQIRDSEPSQFFK